ncbi:MAG: SEC-C metal-binding domain-containing protein [Deltaproteobacteria bacterium]|nr:SEC-C metal-binding domain-containing protein [Deltaproteobacteria bacterium]
MNPIEWIKQAAAGIERVALRATSARPRSLGADVVIVRPDQSEVRFCLEVVEHEGAVRVRERERRLLPTYCPERHINADGWFCLGYQEAFLRPTTIERATEWWQRVRGYLIDQLDAALLSRWPGGVEWKHGDAARWQKKLERACADTPGLLSAVRALARHGRRSMTWDDPCPCGSGRALIRCHGVRVTELLGWARAELDAEREFWESARASGGTCCQTMNGCLLKKEG